MTTVEGPGPAARGDQVGLDALLPAAMARRAEELGIAKAALPLGRMTVLALLAGAFISFGALLSTVATADDGTHALPLGVSRILGGLVFSLGLVLVVVGGAELFTGNTLLVMAWADRRVGARAVLRSWVAVYVGNFAGAVAVAYLVYWSGHPLSEPRIGLRALEIARAKSTLPFLEAVLLGVLANVLVCLAVWLCFSARTVADKMLAIVGPITAFVAAGFEHSIANMYFLPMGILVRGGAPAEFWSAVGRTERDYRDVTVGSFLWRNLVPVTIGNLVGGALLVGLVYWFVYLHGTRHD